MGYMDINNDIIMNVSGLVSTGSGGGLYLVESHVYLDGSVRVANNVAGENGGGMYVLSGSLSSTNTSSLVIAENSIDSDHFIMGHGGGLYICNVSVKFAGSMILTSNIGTHKGGGIFMYNSTCFFASYVLLYNNTAHIAGGGLYIIRGNTVVTNVNISVNTAKGSRGGGLFLFRGNFTVLNEATFINNTAGKKGGANCASIRVVSSISLETFSLSITLPLYMVGQSQHMRISVYYCLNKASDLL